MFCGNCGAKTDENATFCGECGNPIKSEGMAQPDMPPTVSPNVVCPNTASQKSIGIYILAITLVLVVLIFAGAAWFMVFNNHTANNSDLQETEDIASDASAVENEPIETPTPTISPKINIDDINSIISNSGADGVFSIAVWDVKNDMHYYTTNANLQMSASALINIPILFTVADGLKNNSLSLSDMVTFQYTFDGRGTLKREQSGQRFTMGKLLGDMLKYSDNNATNSLIAYLGIDKINQTCNNYGFSSVKLERPIVSAQTTKDNYLSAKDVVSMVGMLYDDKFPIGRDYLNLNLVIEDKIGRNGIGKYIPSNFRFLNHNGVTSDKYNEVAIITDGETEYIVSALSNFGVQEKSANVISDIGHYIHSRLSQ